MTINAFHPEYVKTHMPEFLNNLRTESMYTQKGKELSKHVDKVRETKPTHGTMFGISEGAVSVSPKEMMTKRVSKAGKAPTTAAIVVPKKRAKR